MGILWNAEDDQHTNGSSVRIFSSSGICDEPLDQSSPKVKPSNPYQDNKEMVEIEERSSSRRDRDSSISQERVFSSEEVVADRGRSVTNGEKSVRLRSRSRTPMKIRDNLSHLLGWFHDIEAENDDDVNFENTNSSIDMNKVSFSGPDGVSKLKYYKPCSRLALISSDQYSTFNYEMDLLKSKINDFPLYFQWCFWVWNEKYIGIHSIIENCIDLKVACKTARELYENSKISIFKKGIIPRRKHPINIDGVSIDIQVDHDDAYDLFRSIIKIVTDGTLYKPDIDLVICGVEFKKKSNYSIISMWIHPPLERHNEDHVFNPAFVINLINQLQINVLPSYEQYINTAILVENRTLSTTKICL